MIGIYIRVSTQEQANEGYSIDEQTERCKKYADAMNWPVYKVYTDAGFSGANTDRPALQNMIKDIKRKKINRVLVYKLDRLSRSQLDTLYLIEKVLLANGADFVSMNENFDTSTPFGRAMIGILAVFAQLEREQIKERMQMGKAARAKEGKYSGTRVHPIGYDYINGELIVNEYEKMQVQKIFKMVAEGISPYAITKFMNEHGYTHKSGVWQDQTVRAILRHKTYIGYIHYGDEWLQGIHEPIIDQELFYEVQRILKKRSEQHEKFNRRAGKATTYLGGFIYCGQCGAKYSKNPIKQKRKNGSIYEYNKFSCNSRTKRRKYLVKDPNCKNKHWPIDELTNMVFDEIKKLSLDPEYFNQIIENKKEDEQPAIIQKEIGKIENQISKFMDLYGLDQMPLEVLQTRIHELNDKKLKLENELESIEKEKEKELNTEEIYKTIQSFSNVLENGDFDQIRSVLAILIKKIVINDEEVTIHWNFA